MKVIFDEFRIGELFDDGLRIRQMIRVLSCSVSVVFGVENEYLPLKFHHRVRDDVLGFFPVALGKAPNAFGKILLFVRNAECAVDEVLPDVFKIFRPVKQIFGVAVFAQGLDDVPHLRKKFQAACVECLRRFLAEDGEEELFVEWDGGSFRLWNFENLSEKSCAKKNAVAVNLRDDGVGRGNVLLGNELEVDCGFPVNLWNDFLNGLFSMDFPAI